jgi:YVTN family beta-propeller protein
MLNSYAKIAAVTVLAISAGSIANAQSVKSTITLKNLPEQLAVDLRNDLIYVAVPNFGAKPYDYLTIIDGKTDKVIKNVQIPPVAYAVAVDPLNRKVYVGGSYVDANGIEQSKVIAYCTVTGQIDDNVAVTTTPGDGIQGLAVNLNNGDLYVANGSDNEVDVISGGSRTKKVTQRISVAGEPFGITINPFRFSAYVSLLNGNVSLINTSRKVVLATTPIGESNTGIAVDTLTGNVFTSNTVTANSSTVGVLGHADNVITNVAVGNTPFGLDVDPATKLVFVANSQDGTVSIINETTEATTGLLPVSGLFLAANPITSKVYVGSNDGTPTVTVINEK